MNKKGQVYILAAILLSVVLYELSTVPNFGEQEVFRGEFEKLSDNYETESSKLVNSVLLSGGDVMESFTNFTVLFMSYSKSQNPNFGLITSLSYKNNIRIGNYLKKPVIIESGGNQQQINGCFDKISSLLIFKGLVIDLPAAEVEDIQKCFIQIDYQDTIRIGFKESSEEIVWYPFEVKPNMPQLIIINLMEEGPQRKVGIVGEGYVKSAAETEYNTEA